MKKYNWKFEWLHWLKKNLEGGEPYSLLEMSKERKIPYKTLRNHSAKEKWQEMLAAKKAKIQHKIISTIQISQVTTEAEIRQRQAIFAFRLLKRQWQN